MPAYHVGMPDLPTLASFFGISLVLALSPGPDNLYVLLHAAAHGRKAGLQVVLGLCSGLLLHTLGVALGLAAVFAASSAAFTALKLFGAGYLLWLAWQSLRAPALGAGLAPRQLSGRQSYLRGIVMNLSNPKVLLFFLAFLPQFVDARRGQVALQTLLLGGASIVATLLVFGAIAWAAGRLSRWLDRSARLQRALHWSAAAIFILLALRLATAQR